MLTRISPARPVRHARSRDDVSDAKENRMSQMRRSHYAPVWVTLLLTLVALALAVVAIIYFADTADKLPSFFPGHQAGSTHHHTKHGIAAAIVAVLALAGAWMSRGQKRA
jgi:amino acid permease